MKQEIQSLNKQASDSSTLSSQLKSDLQEKEAEVANLHTRLSETNKQLET